MDKVTIKKQYEDLINKIESKKIYDGRGTFDLYECKSCGFVKFMTYKDKGVTPFTMDCKCGGYMQHTHTYSSIPKTFPVDEFVRPTLEQAYNMNEQELDHLFKGGLFLKSEISDTNESEASK